MAERLEFDRILMSPDPKAQRDQARTASASITRFSVEAWLGNVEFRDVSSVHLAAVDHQCVSRDVAGLVAREVNDSARDVAGFSGNP